MYVVVINMFYHAQIHITDGSRLEGVHGIDSIDTNSVIILATRKQRFQISRSLLLENS